MSTITSVTPSGSITTLLEMFPNEQLEQIVIYQEDCMCKESMYNTCTCIHVGQAPPIIVCQYYFPQIMTICLAYPNCYFNSLKLQCNDKNHKQNPKLLEHSFIFGTYGFTDFGHPVFIYFFLSNRIRHIRAILQAAHLGMLSMKKKV